MEEGDEDNQASDAIGGRRRAGWRDDVTPATSARKSKRAPVDSRGHRQWMAVDVLGRRGDGRPTLQLARPAALPARLTARHQLASKVHVTE